MLQDMKFNITFSKPGKWIIYLALFVKEFGYQNVANKLSSIAVNHFLIIK